MTYSRGMTLVETLITLGMFIAISAVLAFFFSHFYSLFRYQNIFRNTGAAATNAAALINDSVLSARSVVTSHTFSGTTYTSSNTVLVLELPSVDGSGNILSGTYDYKAFVQSGSLLIEAVDAGAGSARVSGSFTRSRTLSSLSFTYNNATISQSTSVVTTVVAQETIGTQSRQSTRTLTTRLRNK